MSTCDGKPAVIEMLPHLKMQSICNANVTECKSKYFPVTVPLTINDKHYSQNLYKGGHVC